MAIHLDGVQCTAAKVIISKSPRCIALKAPIVERDKILWYQRGDLGGQSNVVRRVLSLDFEDNTLGPCDHLGSVERALLLHQMIHDQYSVQPWLPCELVRQHFLLFRSFALSFVLLLTFGGSWECRMGIIFAVSRLGRGWL